MCGERFCPTLKGAQTSLLSCDETECILWMHQSIQFSLKTAITISFNLFRQDGFKTFQVGFHEGHMLVDDVSHSENLFGYALTNDRGQKTGVEWTNCVYQDGVGKDRC